MTVIPQTFYFPREGRLVLILVKAVNDLIFTGELRCVKYSISKLDVKFKFGTIVRGPGIFNFYGMTIDQHDYLSITVHAKDELESTESYPMFCIRCPQCESAVTNIEKSAFMSDSSSLG